VLACGTKSIKTTDAMKDCLGIQDKLILIQDPPLGHMMIDGEWTQIGHHDDCISHSGTFGIAVIIVIIFSVFVQMAEGLHFGIVPYVSRPALGIVSGMVGAGGNLGSVIATWTFFKGRYRTDDGIVNLGIMIIGVTLLLFGVHFPEHGSMLFKKGAIKYDPQAHALARRARDTRTGAHHAQGRHPSPPPPSQTDCQAARRLPRRRPDGLLKGGRGAEGQARGGLRCRRPGMLRALGDRR